MLINGHGKQLLSGLFWSFTLIISILICIMVMSGIGERVSDEKEIVQEDPEDDARKIVILVGGKAKEKEEK